MVREDIDESDVLPEDMDEGIKEQLGRLRLLTQMTGAIHEAQMLQLKVWPRLLFSCDQHAIEHNGTERILVVTMRLTEDLPPADELRKRVKAFERWCWALLGPEWSIRLRYRKGKGGRSKELHHGARKVALPKAAKPLPEYGVEVTSEFKRYRQPDTKKAAPAVAEDLPPILPVRKP